MEKAQDTCSQLDIVSPLDSSDSGRSHRQPNRLRDFVMDRTPRHRTEILSEEEYKK